MDKTEMMLIFVLGFSVALITIGLVDHFSMIQILEPIACKAGDCICGYNVCV